jgi:hypothetical protein
MAGARRKWSVGLWLGGLAVAAGGSALSSLIARARNNW